MFNARSTGIALVLAASSITSVSKAADATDAPSDRYGLLNLLDHRSRYGQFWFPEPFRVDELDVDNEVRVDWSHQETHGQVDDGVTAEVEKSFRLLTVEVEVPYSRQSQVVQNPVTGRFERANAQGVDNISIGARHPLYQYVSDNEFFDNTIGAGFEVGIPSNSPISKNTELVPTLFDALRLGDHFSIQSIVGYSVLLGSGDDGGLNVFEYAAVFGYSWEHEQFPVPHVGEIIPIFELKGELELNHADAGHNTLDGTLGIRVNFDPIGPVQPRLGIGYIFPIDQGARDEFHWGIITSLVFEY